MSINIIFGSSGLVGSAFAELVKKKKNYIFYSKNNNKFKNIWNLNKNLKNFPYKQIDTLFFFASPRFVKRNFNYKAYAREVLWLKNIVKYLCISKIVYLSSSGIFYKKKNFIGINKLACEHYLKKNKHKFNYIQIWRPFNLVGRNQSRSDHFHNLAIRKMFEERKEIFFFSGSANDQRGYSDIKSFVKVLLNYSKKNISFIKNYGNKNLIKTSEIINIYNHYYNKIFQKFFNAKFVSKTFTISKVSNRKNSIYELNSSESIIKKYLKKYLNEKKMLNLQK